MLLICFGLFVVVLLGVMLLGVLNYNNNFVLLLVLLLGVIGIVSVISVYL